MRKLNQEMKCISKIIEIFSKKENEKEMEECNIRLILFKNNQVVLSHMLDNVHNLITSYQPSSSYDYNYNIQIGSEFYISHLIDLFNNKSIGVRYNKDISGQNSSSKYPGHDDNNKTFDDEVRLILIENNQLILSKNLSELPKLFRTAYINNIKLEIENIMEIDGGFVCIKEYENWLTRMSKFKIEISNIGQKALILFEKLNKIKM